MAIAQEAVNGSGGLNWYPFALASIAVAELVLRLAQQVGRETRRGIGCIGADAANRVTCRCTSSERSRL